MAIIVCHLTGWGRTLTLSEARERPRKQEVRESQPRSPFGEGESNGQGCPKETQPGAHRGKGPALSTLTFCCLIEVALILFGRVNFEKPLCEKAAKKKGQGLGRHGGWGHRIPSGEAGMDNGGGLQPRGSSGGSRNSGPLQMSLLEFIALAYYNLHNNFPFIYLLFFFF